MIARTFFLVCFSVTLFVFLSACGPEELPKASLWTDGAWVLYEQTQIDADEKEVKGSLKVSSVGKELVDNKLYHWIEIREDNEKGVIITKFLATENAVFDPNESFIFWDDIKRIIIQENSRTPEEIPAQHLKRFSPSFVESGKAKRFGNIKDQSPPTVTEMPDLNMTVSGQKITAKGTKHSRIFTSSVNLGFLNLEDTTESSTEYYICQQVPFGGLVKAIHASTTTSINKLKPEETPKPPHHFENTLILKEFGTSGAISQVIGDPVEKQVLPFPFLKDGVKKP